MKPKKEFLMKEAKIIGIKLGINWLKFDVDQFRKGLNIELEHGKIHTDTNVSNDKPLVTGKIALAHLNEFPDYYDRLEKLEKEAKKFWSSRSKK